MANAMPYARVTRAVGRRQTCRSILAGLGLLSFGLVLPSAGYSQSDLGYPLPPSQDHVGIPSLAPVVEAVIPSVVHLSAVQRPKVARADEENSGRLRRSKHQSGGGDLSPAELDALLRRFFSDTSALPI